MFWDVKIPRIQKKHLFPFITGQHSSPSLCAVWRQRWMGRGKVFWDPRQAWGGAGPSGYKWYQYKREHRPGCIIWGTGIQCHHHDLWRMPECLKLDVKNFHHTAAGIKGSKTCNEAFHGWIKSLWVPTYYAVIREKLSSCEQVWEEVASSWPNRRNIHSIVSIQLVNQIGWLRDNAPSRRTALTFGYEIS